MKILLHEIFLSFFLLILNLISVSSHSQKFVSTSDGTKKFQIVGANLWLTCSITNALSLTNTSITNHRPNIKHLN